MKIMDDLITHGKMRSASSIAERCFIETNLGSWEVPVKSSKALELWSEWTFARRENNDWITIYLLEHLPLYILKSNKKEGSEKLL